MIKISFKLHRKILKEIYLYFDFILFDQFSGNDYLIFIFKTIY